MNNDKKREEYIWVLDFLPRGHPEDERPAYQKEPLIQGIGEKYFMILESAPKKGNTPSQYDRLYVGRGERKVVDHVKKRIDYEDLTHGAQLELPYIIEEIVKENEERFIDIFNNAQPITTRKHTLELLPGIGKKLMWKILDAREESEFSSFDDLLERVDGIHNPEKILANRVVKEIKGEDVKYKIFVEG